MFGETHRATRAPPGQVMRGRSVIGRYGRMSAGVVIELLADRQVAGRVDVRLRARRDRDGRVRLKDDRGTGEGHAGEQRAAFEDGRGPAPLPVVPGHLSRDPRV